jgi:streptogramin lyase
MRGILTISRRQAAYPPFTRIFTPAGSQRAAVSSFSLAALLLVAGCGGNGSSRSIPFNPASAGLKGRVFGGQQPIQGAEVRLFAAGSSGYGTGANLLLPATTTDVNGNFSFSGSYTCPSGQTPAYLLATGGDPGIGVNNPALAMIAGVGSCGSLGSAPLLVINEVTTAAFVWALTPFVGAGGQVGASPANTLGLLDGFASLSTLVNSSNGNAPGSSVPGAVIPTLKINTLANIIAACVNSTGTGVCDTLFADSTPASGPPPQNTLEAALNIVRNPSNEVAKLFAIAGPISPFQPMLPMAPSDWTLALTYSGGGLDTPSSVSIDAVGNIWVSNYFNSVSEFSNDGQALSPQGGFKGGGLNESYGIAVSENGNIWITDEESSGFNGGLGTITVLNSSGAVTSGAQGYFAGGVDFPLAVAADTDGSVWIANFGNSTATKLSSTGLPLSGSAGFGNQQLQGPVAIAIDAGHNAWFVNYSASPGSVTSVSPDGSQVHTTSCCGESPSGVATDAVGISTHSSNGHVWTTNYGSSTVTELQLNDDGSVTVVSPGETVGGLSSPNGIAVDGAGNVWVANFVGDTLTELEGAGGTSPATPLSPSGGLGQDANLSRPYGIAIDSSGNIWVSDQGTNAVTEFLGAATPVKTPLLGPPQLP